MQQPNPITIFWFRRDLRLEDNAGLYHALKENQRVLPVFIFDTDILNRLNDKTDRRVTFIHQEITRLNTELQKLGSSLLVKIGSPQEIWEHLLKEYAVKNVYINRDYEPTAVQRDEKLRELLKDKGIPLFTYKDQVIFEKYEILKDDGKPYTIFTPYSKKWKAKLAPFYYKPYPSLNYTGSFCKTEPIQVPGIESIGFLEKEFIFPSRIVRNHIIKDYSLNRDYPALNGTTKLGIHLRFGTISVRKLLADCVDINQTYVNELMWREFYQMILCHFPYVVNEAFKREYDLIEWENDESKFAAWCEGNTGFPLVDAGIRELNATGYMHNRVRMVVASFLTNNLLIDWRWGEAYFAEKLLDFELASNNGGWQWAAGCGTDAAPYFRVFNPALQMQKFDPELKYVKYWIPEYGTARYAKPIIDIGQSREKMFKAYHKALRPE